MLVTDLRPYECDVSDCKKTFKAPSDLHNHKKTCHVKPTLYCDLCGKGQSRRFFSRSRFIIHTIGYRLQKEIYINNSHDLSFRAEDSMFNLQENVSKSASLFFLHLNRFESAH